MSLPFVPLENVPAHGLVVPVGVWALARAEEALVGKHVQVEGELRIARVGRDLHVQGELRAAATVACDRCGADVALRTDAELDCLYAAPRADDEALPEEAYADIGEYDGAQLDLAHVVGESLALERPARVRCSDLDPAEDGACLARWRAAAGNPETAPDPRLAALAGVKTSR